MTLDEAIRILKELAEEDKEDHNLDTSEAEELAIQALKRCKAYKEAHYTLPYEPMPGETEE